MIPDQIKTKDGCIKIKVLPWLQYIKYRVSLRGVGYMFERTSAGYPRVFSLGYYSKSMKEIVVAKVGNWRLRLEHEEGHANGFWHVMIRGDVMHPYGILRGAFKHTCSYIDANAGTCRYDNTVSMNCYCNGMLDSCVYLDVKKL
ncbi:MAG: hypothetical protein KAJ93_02435 [Methanosarcinales archaeon]|nr:hypothetical protein [Methanosarcinales archaeon]